MKIKWEVGSKTRCSALAFLILVTMTSLSPRAWGGRFFREGDGRYFLAGDGTISLQSSKTGASAVVRYREKDGSYDPKAVRRVGQIFGVPRNASEGISLRLISLLDALQDHFRAGLVRIVSGYRSPEYNAGLRRKGKLAARTSLHIEGMAADIEMPGVDARRLWEYTRGLDCCGAGYYHGKGIHIDTGPPRFWDETSSGVEKDLGGHNKLILLRTGQDIYLPGEVVRLILARITDYPIGVARTATLLQKGKEVQKIKLDRERREIAPAPPSPAADRCLLIPNRRGSRSLTWVIPKDFRPTEKLRLRLDFCERPSPEMPDTIESNPVEVTAE